MHFTNAYVLIEVSGLFRHNSNSANIYIYIFIKLEFLMPTSSFKAIRGVMIPAKLTLGPENKLNFLGFLHTAILGRQPGWRTCVFFPGFSPRLFSLQLSLGTELPQ